MASPPTCVSGATVGQWLGLGLGGGGLSPLCDVSFGHLASECLAWGHHLL